MKKLGAIYSNKVFLLPVIVAVSFFLVFLGVRPPTLPKLQKPNVHNRAVVEVQTKTTKAASTKAGKDRYAAETCRHIDIIVQTGFHSPPPSPEYRINHLTVIRQLQSRAPPASQA